MSWTISTVLDTPWTINRTHRPKARFHVSGEPTCLFQKRRRESARDLRMKIFREADSQDQNVTCPVHEHTFARLCGQNRTPKGSSWNQFEWHVARTIATLFWLRAKTSEQRARTEVQACSLLHCWALFLFSLSLGVMCPQTRCNGSVTSSDEEEHNVWNPLEDTLVEYQSVPLLQSDAQDPGAVERGRKPDLLWASCLCPKCDETSSQQLGSFSAGSRNG